MPKESLMHHIMFDIDGTLVKSDDFDEDCFIAAVSDVLGHDIDPYLLLLRGGGGGGDVLRKVMYQVVE